MRSSLLALALYLTGCTPALCGRTSDCPTGQVCAATGACGIPPDAGGDAGPDAGTASDSEAPSDDASGPVILAGDR
jgi:hypothetical protein